MNRVAKNTGLVEVVAIVTALTVVPTSSQWLEKQTARLLPTHYFLVTFTVPKQLRFVLRGSQRDGYAAIFDAGSEAIRTVAGASKYLRGCQLGFFGVLHIWGRDVAVYHPHVHFVVPGGGVNEAEGVWQQTPENFFLPHAALSKVYKASSRIIFAHRASTTKSKRLRGLARM